tara:strand:+ start:6146 stop:7036 length:891 start_codon:yes stop_codon:yes gene_type:complete
MFKYLISLVFLFTCSLLIAQPNTEVFVMDLKFSENDFNIESFKNISNNPGYDSQPFFIDNEQIVYARTYYNQTDIAKYHLKNESQINLSETKIGGEYSPQKIPNSNYYAAVRLDTTGLQRLYKYDSDSKQYSLLFGNLQVAYFSFYDQNRLLTSVLSGANLDLVYSDISKKSNDTLLVKVGRSIHKVPNTINTMSYTSVNDEGNMDIYQLDITTLESFFVSQLPIGIQDHIWLNEATLLIGSLDKLFLLDLFGNGDWKLVADLSKYNIKDITRLAISPDGSKLAMVAELKPAISNK